MGSGNAQTGSDRPVLLAGKGCLSDKTWEMTIPKRLKAKMTIMAAPFKSAQGVVDLPGGAYTHKYFRDQTSSLILLQYYVASCKPPLELSSRAAPMHAFNDPSPRYGHRSPAPRYARRTSPTIGSTNGSNVLLAHNIEVI